MKTSCSESDDNVGEPVSARRRGNIRRWLVSLALFIETLVVSSASGGTKTLGWYVAHVEVAFATLFV